MREGLPEVVIGPQFEGVGLVVFAILGGQHEDRCPDVLGAEVPTHLVAVHFGKHDVEHDGVVRTFPGAPQAVGARLGEIHTESVRFEAPLH